jgi:D-beta-D-heptose 7-phosphate kinase/D-beta-D-heptose 1-phosphate adenosyltransferase
LSAFLSRFERTRVLVAGDLMLDEYIWGTVQRVSPEAPVPVVEVERRTFVPGGAANTAANVGGLGGRAVLLSVVGRDEAGAALCGALRADGVETEAVLPVEGRPTTTKTRVIAHSQQVVRFDRETREPLPRDVEDRLLARVDDLLTTVQSCVLSDYAKGLASPRFVAELIRKCRREGKPIVVDPKGTDYGKYRGATVLKPNQHEAGKALNRELRDEEGVREAGRRLLEMVGGGAVLITRGAHGMSLFEPGREAVHIPAQAHEVFDVTGAGDTVAGTLATALAAGASLEQATRLASCAAGVVVGKVGTAAIQFGELVKQWWRGSRRPRRPRPPLTLTGR